MITRLIKISTITALTLLSACVHNKTKFSCPPGEALPLKSIESDELSNYWVAIKSTQAAYFDSKTSKAIANGEIAGFVVVNQTIDANGSIRDSEVIGYYPDKSIAETHLKFPIKFKYKSEICPIQPVRYKTVHYYSSHKKVSEKLEKIYEAYEKSL